MIGCNGEGGGGLFQGSKDGGRGGEFGGGRRLESLGDPAVGVLELVGANEVGDHAEGDERSLGSGDSGGRGRWWW